MEYIFVLLIILLSIEKFINIYFTLFLFYLLLSFFGRYGALLKHYKVILFEVSQ